MKDFICANCMKSFKSIQDGNNDEFQMMNCSHCESILYWKFNMNTNVAKLFEDYSKLNQFSILFDIEEAFKDKRY